MSLSRRISSLSGRAVTMELDPRLELLQQALEEYVLDRRRPNSASDRAPSLSLTQNLFN
jgi:hypothetical protein